MDVDELLTSTAPLGPLDTPFGLEMWEIDELIVTPGQMQSAPSNSFHVIDHFLSHSERTMKEPRIFGSTSIPSPTVERSMGQMSRKEFPHILPIESSNVATQTVSKLKRCKTHLLSCDLCFLRTLRILK